MYEVYFIVDRFPQGEKDVQAEKASASLDWLLCHGTEWLFLIKWCLNFTGQ